MVEGELRRQQIMQTLASAEKPVSASKFAKKFGVSRQIIVGDIALLRAAGEEVVATARGYILESNETNTGFVSKIAVQHERQQTEEELQIIIEHGGEVVDVIVEHPLYGELVGMLHLKRYEKSQATLLSELTAGIHLHTIRYPDEATLKKIKRALSTAHILYED